MSRKWTQERREAFSKTMKEYWAKRSFRRKHKMAAQKRRDEGLNLVNIAQLESDKNYRDYQRLQHRDWYNRNREKWNEYSKHNRLLRKSFDELFMLREKHQNWGRLDLVDQINSVLEEKLAREEQDIKMKADRVMRGEPV